MTVYVQASKPLYELTRSRKRKKKYNYPSVQSSYKDKSD